MPEVDPLIAASGLGVTLGGRAVLHGVDLSIAPGEIVARLQQGS